jgi:hypothetical protein
MLWRLATIDHPVRMPDFASEMIISRLDRQGIHLQARNLWILPDLTIAADDLTVGIEGLTGEVFTATRLELSLDSGQLMVGQVAPTRLRLAGARAWCPASVSLDGQRHALTEEIAAEISQEGRWIILRTFQIRAGKLTLSAEGELPAALLRLAEESSHSRESVPLARMVSAVFSRAEEILGAADRSGGATIALRCAGNAEGGADISAHALFGNDWTDKGLGLIQVRSLELRGDLRLNRQARPTAWHVRGSADELAWQEKRARTIRLNATGGSRTEQTRIAASIGELSGGGFGGARVQGEARPGTGGAWSADLQVLTTDSSATVNYRRAPDGSAELTIGHARLAARELLAAPAFGKGVREAGIRLDGDILLRDVALRLDPTGEFLGCAGEASCSGFEGLGLSAAAIAPTKTLPLRTRFDYDPRRAAAPLRLRDLRLATVTGEADCALTPGGAFVLHLNGEIHPPSLDRILGEWWLSLWRLFEVRRDPYAFIDVESRWGSPRGVVRGRVLLEDFHFMGAPFRHVEVGVDTNEQRSSIGLHHLAGGSSAADGYVDGSAIWDWSKPAAEAGPVVKASGNIQPWIAARCASKELGEALRGVVLPPDHQFELLVQPGERGPSVNATITSQGEFRAWGVSGQNLRVTSSNRPDGMSIEAKLGLAGGQAELSMLGDPLHRTNLSLRLRGSDPAQITKIIAELNGTPDKTEPAKAAAKTPAKLDLDFKGSMDFDNPRQLKGIGNYVLDDPELRKVRLLGGVSNVLEAIGLETTTYDLTRAQGSFGCLGGRAFFPDMVISGPQSLLLMRGEVDLTGATLDFEGDFSLPRKGGFNPLELLNLNRTLVSLTKIKVKGPLSKPETSALPSLKDIIKSKNNSNLGKIPDAAKE